MSINRWIDKEDVVHIYNKYTMEYNSVIKKESIPFLSTGMDLNIIILSANRQRKICITWYYLYMESKCDIMNLFPKQKQIHWHRKQAWLPHGIGEGQIN